MAPRTGIPDDLPIIDCGQTIEGVVILNPTSHLGCTQSIALGKLASLYVLHEMGKLQNMPESLPLHEYRIDRFKEDLIRVRNDRKAGKVVTF